MKIDLKSAIFGLAFGILAMLAIAASDSPSVSQKYQVSGGSGFFVIMDGETGQAWWANLATPGFTGVQAGFWDKKPGN